MSRPRRRRISGRTLEGGSAAAPLTSWLARFKQAPQSAVYAVIRRSLGLLVLRTATYMSQTYSYEVGDKAFDGAHEGHLQTATPPGTDGDERLGCTYSEVSDERDQGRHKHCRKPSHEEEWNDRHEGSDGSRNCSGDGSGKRIAQAFFIGVQAFPGQRLDELRSIRCQVVHKAICVFGRKSPDLIAEGEDFPSLRLIVFH